MISKILPDNEMPIMVENGTGKKKVVEVVMNPKIINGVIKLT